MDDENGDDDRDELRSGWGSWEVDVICKSCVSICTLRHNVPICKTNHVTLPSPSPSGQPQLTTDLHRSQGLTPAARHPGCTPGRIHRPSIRLSVTRQYSIETAKHIMKLFYHTEYQHHSSFSTSTPNHRTVWQYRVFPVSNETPLTRASNAEGYEKITIFGQYIALSRI